MPKNVRNLIFICAAIYIAAYIGRLSYSAAMVGIMEATDAAKSSAGLVSTFFYLTYGCGQLVNAFLCKHYKPRQMIAGVMLVSAGANIVAALAQDVSVIKYVWLLNGAAQSVLWCTLIQLISCKVPTEYRNSAIFAMSLTVAIGTSSIYGIAALCMALDHVFLTFWIAAVIVICAVAAWLWITRVLPQMPDVHHDKNTAAADSKGSSAGRGRVSILLFLPFIVCGILAIGNGFMKDTMVTWVPSLLYDVFSVPTSFSVLITLLLPLLSVCGTALSLGIRKVISNHNISQAVLFLGAAAAFTGVYISCRMHFMPGVILFAGMNACLMAAINNIITSVIPLERGSGAGLFAGIMDACCYVGSTLSGFLPGLIIERGGFDPLLSSLPVCALALAVFTLAVTFFRIKRKKD